MLKYSKAIGANTDYLTSQSFVFPKVFPETDPQTPVLAVLITASGEDVFVKVRQTSPEIEQAFLENNASVGDKLQQISALIKEKLGKIESLQYTVAVLKTGTLYLKSEGGNKAYLIRAGEILELTAQPGASQMISGYFQVGDKLVLISPKSHPPDQNTIWEPKFIQKLSVASLEDGLEDEIEEFININGHADPIASIVVESLPEEKIQSAQSQLENLDQSFEKEVKKFDLKPKIRAFLTLLKKLAPKNKKSRFITGGVLVALVIISLIFFSFQTKNLEKKGQVSSFVTLAREKFSQAQTLKDSQPEQSLSLLQEARVNLGRALEIDPDSREAKSFQKELSEGSDSILKVFNVSDFPVFLSLELVKEGFNPTRMSESLGNVLLLDEKEMTLVAIDLENKTNRILAGQPQLGDAKFASINGENVFIFSPDKGVTKIDLSAPKNPKPEVIVKPDGNWGQIAGLVAFSSNFYLLDASKNQIYKYSPIQSGYSNMLAYLKDGQGISFGGAKRMQIDYSVWILKSGPEILKFTGGYADSFSVSGMEENIGEVESFYVAEGETIDSQNSYVYLLDKDNSRLVVLTKKGAYFAQYKGEKFATATDLVVDEKGKKIYLLEGGQILQIDSRH